MPFRREFDLRQIALGAYYPGVFIIKINKILHEGIQYDEFDREDWKTFVHEYVHFLQDISTSHGYLYYFHKSQLFNLCFYELQTNTTGTVALPILTEHTKVRNELPYNSCINGFIDLDDASNYNVKVDWIKMLKEMARGLEIVFLLFLLTVYKMSIKISK